MASRTYDQALDIASDYLGPAADRFLHRQVVFHLKKQPENLSTRDIPQLAEWVKVSIGILTNDERLVEEFARRIMNISKGKNNGR